MNANEILDMIGDAKGTYVWDAQMVRAGYLADTKKRLSGKKLWLIAALIALTLLLVGCAVVYALSLRDMKVGEYSVTKPGYYGANWVLIEPKEKTVEVLSVQGFSNSPNQQAAKEYGEYLYSVDTKSVFDQEAMEKLWEILDKYDLKLLRDGIYVNYMQSQILLDALRLPGVCIDRPYAQVEYSSGNFFQEGSFELYVNIEPDGKTFDWPYNINAEFLYYRKGYFINHYVMVEDLDSFQEWQYTMPDGGTALIAVGQEKGLIVAERENGTFCVEFRPHIGIDTMTKATVEMLADLFDFSIVPHVLSEEEMESIRTELQRLYELDRQERMRLQEEHEDSRKKESFAEWVKETLRDRYYEEVKDLGYAFLDIDGNGVDDLLIGRDGYCTAIFLDVDGEARVFSNAAEILYPCENHGIGYRITPFDTDFYFSRADDGVLRGSAHIMYVPGHPEGEYREYSLEVWGKYENITKERFDSIMNSYVRIPITFLPLTDYPLDEQVLLPSDENQASGVECFESVRDYERYEEKIRIALTHKEEEWPRWKYDIRDLNDDGVDEMIWSEDGRVWIYTMVDGCMRQYRTLDDGSVTPCKNGIVEAIQHYSAVNKTYRYYRLEGDRTVLVDYLRYDVDANPENPWFQSPDLTGQDLTLKLISESEARTIIASYEPLEIDMKPIAEYPFE